jgi:hypothetical protein
MRMVRSERRSQGGEEGLFCDIQSKAMNEVVCYEGEGEEISSKQFD